jgi:hypothetical protein
MPKVATSLFVCLAALAACEPVDPPSFEANIAAAMAKIARTPGYVTFEMVEAELHLQEAGLQTKYAGKQEHQLPGWGYQGYSILRYDPVRSDARIEYVIIDNIAHGGDLEQEVRVNLRQGTCITADMMRRALGITPRPYVDNWVPPPHYPSHYTRPPTYDLEFVVRDKYPEDDRGVFLANGPPCFRVIVVQKHFKETGGK